MLPGVGTYSAYAGHTPDDLLELVGVRRKEMYKAILKQESIPVGCLLPTIRAPVATTRCHSGDGGSQVNTFEQVSSICHQMSLLK